MKLKLLLSFFCIASITTLVAQNPLLDGINANKSERTVSDETYSEFKATETSNCSFQFNRKNYIDYVMDYSILYQKYTWNWKDVTYVELGENKVQISTTGSKISLESKDKESDQITPSNESSVTFFFNSQDEANKAGQWVVDKIKSCGGSAVYAK